MTFIKKCHATSFLLATLPFFSMASERDPMISPQEAASQPSQLGSGSDSPVSVVEGYEGGLVIYVKEKKNFLVFGGHLYAQGERIGKWKIEKISETEVWLREGKEITKIQRYAGIQRSLTKPKHDEK